MYRQDEPEILEMHDKSSDLAVDIFYVWRRRLPGIVWVKAVVDQYDGLFMHQANSTEVLHFNSATCGYEGNGVYATAEILVMAHNAITKQQYLKVLGQHKHLVFEFKGGEVLIWDNKGNELFFEKEHYDE